MPSVSEEARLAIVEVKVEHLENTAEKTEKTLLAIDNKVDHISTHIAKQNGTLPFLEKNMNILVNRLNQNEKETTQTTTKVKITWALLSSLGTGLILLLLKIVLGI